MVLVDLAAWQGSLEANRMLFIFFSGPLEGQLSPGQRNIESESDFCSLKVVPGLLSSRDH